jgi:hypothetical protein
MKFKNNHNRKVLILSNQLKILEINFMDKNMNSIKYKQLINKN